MPTSETTINKKDKDYRSWWIVVGIGLAIVVILGVILLVVSVLRSNNTNPGASIPTNSIASIDTASPDTAVAKINTQLINAVQNVQSSDPNATFNAFLTTLVGNQSNATTMKFGITYALEDTNGEVNVEFQGDLQKGDASQSALQGSATIHANTTDTPDITVPVDLILTNQKLYIKVNTPTGGNLPPQYASIGLLEGKWIKIDLQSYFSLPGITGNNSAQDLLDSQKRQDLLQLWSTNPPLINPKRIADRTVSGVTLQCMTAEMNPNAFKDVTTAQDYPPVEICSNNAKTPVYIGVVMNQNGQKITAGITLVSFGEPVNIVEPTENVVDLSGLLGNTAK